MGQRALRRAPSRGRREGAPGARQAAERRHTRRSCPPPRIRGTRELSAPRPARPHRPARKGGGARRRTGPAARPACGPSTGEGRAAGNGAAKPERFGGCGASGRAAGGNRLEERRIHRKTQHPHDPREPPAGSPWANAARPRSDPRRTRARTGGKGGWGKRTWPTRQLLSAEITPRHSNHPSEAEKSTMENGR